MNEECKYVISNQHRRGCHEETLQQVKKIINEEKIILRIPAIYQPYIRKYRMMIQKEIGELK